MATTRPNSVSQDGRLADVLASYIQAVDAGETPDRDTIVAAHPEIASELAQFFADTDQFDRLVAPFRQPPLTSTTLFDDRNGASASGSEQGLPRAFGDYELVEEIARGGMGIVFKARNVRLERIVALKMILAGHLATPMENRRFRVEAENIAQLDHPNIVPLYEVGSQDGQHYFTMRLVDGGSLASEILRFTSHPRAAVELMVTVARAVHYAHQRGILHRDLKPANILLDKSGQPHVTDFGLAKRLVRDASLASVSSVVGTPSYMAPEQASRNRALSTASDVFSLGAILYELLTGRSPFRADTAFDTLLQVVQKDPERPRAFNQSVDRDLETVCLKCLAKDPGNRYQSALALAEDLERWLAGEPIKARATSAWKRLRMWVRRRPSMAALVAASFLVVVIGIAGLAAGFLAVAAERNATLQALAKYKQALKSEQSALRRMSESSYYQTIAMAAPEIAANNIGRADRLLDSCPAELRRWEWGALKRLAHAETRSFDFPAEPAAVALSRDGSLLAAAGGALAEPGTIALWDMSRGRSLRTFTGHTDAITGLAFDPARNRLATAGRDRTVRIWDTASGKELRALRGHDLPLAAVAFRPDAGLVASADEGGVIKLWDASSGAERKTLSGHTAAVWTLAFAPDGSTLASAGADHTIKLWDVATCSLARVLRGHTGIVHGVAFSSDGGRVASAAYDATARVWDAVSGHELVTFRGHSRYVTGVSFSSDCRHVASSSLDGTIAIWTAVSGEPVVVLHGHLRGVWGVVFGNDGRTIASIGADRTTKVWDLPALAIESALHANKLPISQAALSAGDSRITVRRNEPGASASVSVELWDLNKAQCIRSQRVDRRGQCVSALCPDAELIALTDPEFNDEYIRVMSIRDGQEKKALRAPKSGAASLAYSHDGRRLTVVASTGSALLWDIANDRWHVLRDDRTLPTARSSRPQVLFDEKGERLALWAGVDRNADSSGVTIFDAATGVSQVAISHAGAPLAFSHDGSAFLARGSERDGAEATVFDTSDGHECARLLGHTGLVTAAAFGIDGDRIVTASRDGTLKVWDASGRELVTLTTGGRELTHLRFSERGTRLIGADDSGNVLIWEGGATGPYLVPNP
jgi:WD40 repeat protein/tRNA A-37 threonylcarbamoyl transferase component Bud32